MKPDLRIWKIFIFSALLNQLVGQESFLYLYLIPFENTENDPTIEWIAPGLSDMAREQLKTEFGIKIQTKDDLEVIMNDRSLMLKQARGSKNMLFLGKYIRKLDKIHVNIQLVDVATWQEEDSQKIIEVYSAIPALNQAVGKTVKKMVSPFLPKKLTSNRNLFSYQPEPKLEKKNQPLFKESQKVVSNLDSQILELEASMDALLGARKRDDVRPKKNLMRKIAGEWTLDFDVDRKMEPNPENAANTRMLSTVLEQLINNPYDIELQRPEFIYHDDDELYMTVRFPVIYKLKEQIIKDMLTTLPYTGLEQNGSLTIFYFDKESFNFPPDIVETIKTGSYRSVPVIRIFDKNENILIVIADSPENSIHQKQSNKILYLPQNQFSPLIEFTVGGWSMQVAMETVEINAVYEMILPVSEVKSLSNVSLKFIKETELINFLTPLL
tara:strand:- start:29341 stop:30660 length:1320 start_codon:yes stop_codon:yes gene_type:complete